MGTTINEFSEILKKDLEGAKKSRTMTIIVGAVLFLVVFFIFMSLAGALKSNVTPAALADTTSYVAREMVKEGRPVVEKAFKQNIEVFLSNLRRSLLNEVIPAMRTQLEVDLKKVIKQSFLSSSRSFNVAVKEAVAKVKPLAQEQGDPTPDVLASLIVREFNLAKKKRYTDKPVETLGAQFEQSKAMLEGLNRKLLLMTSKKKPKSKEEALEMKFLRAWVSMLSPGQGELKPLEPTP